MESNPLSFACGHMGGAPVPKEEWCAALQQLLREHEPLRERMETFYKMAKEMADGSADAKQIRTLYEQVSAFAEVLDPHSEREEGALFPMMAKYIGRESGPIAVMEHEHAMAKEHLKSFLDNARAVTDTDKERVQAMVKDAIEAYLILSDHFMKEENVLFPLAHKILGEDEKEELAAKIRA